MTGWIERAMPHLIVAPIVLPLVAAALMVALGDRRRVARALVNVLASGACLAVAVALALLGRPPGRAGGDRRLPAVELAGAVRHRARRRPALAR